MNRRALWVLVALLSPAAFAPKAHAHEVRPGYLELQQTGAERWNVLWKVPAQGELRLAMRPRFPAPCVATAEPVAALAVGAYTERSTMVCSGGLVGQTIGIDGLSATLTDVLVRLVRADDTVQVVRLTPSAPAFVVEAVPGVFDVARAYTWLGVEHILGGVDHLLFVLGLLLLVRDRWMLLKTVTAFTIAHSLTLAAATLGWVQVAQAPVEAVIALSILFLASELIKRHRGYAGLTEHYPWAVAFIFGLLHGLGFAGALREVGLPESDIALALLTFNIGVELGQLMFVGAVLLLVAALRRVAAPAPAWIRTLPAYGIGTMAMFWWLQRMAPLF